MSRTVTRIREERERLRSKLRATRAAAAALAMLLLILLTMGSGAATEPAEPEEAPSTGQAAQPVQTRAPDTPQRYRPDRQEDSAKDALAKTVWGEARGCSKTQQAAVVWCVLNRVDSEAPYFPDSIVEVVTQRGQFDGYDPDNPVEPDILKPDPSLTGRTRPVPEDWNGRRRSRLTESARRLW